MTVRYMKLKHYSDLILSGYAIVYTPDAKIIFQKKVSDNANLKCNITYCWIDMDIREALVDFNVPMFAKKYIVNNLDRFNFIEIGRTLI